MPLPVGKSKLRRFSGNGRRRSGAARRVVAEIARQGRSRPLFSLSDA